MSPDVNESPELAAADRPEDAGRYFQFELLPVHTGSRNRLGRKMFECDVCSGVYRHSFSLKRHYLRNHINRRYISRVDALNCNLTFCGGGDNDDDGDLPGGDEATKSGWTPVIHQFVTSKVIPPSQLAQVGADRRCCDPQPDTSPSKLKDRVIVLHGVPVYLPA